MLLSSIPYKFATPWGAGAITGAVTNPIPPTATGGNASQQLGFPPITATDPGAGGIPPSYADENGCLFYVTSWAQWFQAGGPMQYDATFSSNIGGYPQGAMLANAATLGSWWISSIDNNTSDPDTGGANWLTFPQPRGTGFFGTAGSYDFTIPAGVTTAKVTMGGGGGGGAGGDGSQAGGGGGAGAQAVIYLTGLVPGQHITGSIGAPGSAGGAGASGGNGGNTTLVLNTVLLVTTTGGTGGAFASDPAGGPGGGVVIGTFAGAFVGLPGGYGTDGSPGTNTYGGDGAPGLQGTGSGRGGSGGGISATSYSAGGGGGYGATPGTGGTGFQGFVLIEY